MTMFPFPEASFPKFRLSSTRPAPVGIPAAHGIYRLVCLPLKLAYVGQAYDLYARALQHQQQLREGTHANPRLQGAYRKFGPSAFYFQVLELWSGRWAPDCLSPAEQRWMDLHGPQRLFNVRRAGTNEYLQGVQGTATPAVALPGRSQAPRGPRAGGKPISPGGNSSVTGEGPVLGGESLKLDGESRPPGRGSSKGEV